jgi:hypothetical protein
MVTIGCLKNAEGVSFAETAGNVRSECDESTRGKDRHQEVNPEGGSIIPT